MSKSNRNSSSAKNESNKKVKEKTGSKKLPVESLIGTGFNKSSLPTRPSSSLGTNDNDNSSNQFIEVNNKKHSYSSNNRKSVECVSATQRNGTIIKSVIDPMEKPFEFLPLKYQYVTLSSKNTIATRAKCANNVIFFNRPIKLGEKLVLKVLKKDADPTSSFLLGMTTCGLQKIESVPGHLVEFCKPFFKCGGYSIHNHVNYANSVGDIVEVERLKTDGSLRVRTNGRQSGIRDMTDGARFKTARAVPFINLNLGVSCLQIIHDYKEAIEPSIVNQQSSLKHRMDIAAPNAAVLNRPNVPVGNSVIQSSGPSRSPFESSSPHSSLGGDATALTIPAPVGSSMAPPPPGFGPKTPLTNRPGVPFSEHINIFGFEIRTPSPITSRPEANLQSKPTYSQLFQKDDPKAIRRPSSECKNKIVYADSLANLNVDIKGSSKKKDKPKRTTKYADLCDIDLVNGDLGNRDVKDTEPMSRQLSKLNIHSCPVASVSKVVTIEKWITSSLVVKKDMCTIERDDKIVNRCEEGRFYAFLKQPLEPNSRCTFKIKTLLDLNKFKNISAAVLLNNTLTFGLTNVKMSNVRKEVDMLPANPLDLVNRSYEEWFISTNVLSNPYVGMIFHIERNRDGEIFVCSEAASTTKDWFLVETEKELTSRERKSTFNVFYCSEYYLFLSLRGIISSIELVAITKLSEEYNNNIAPEISLNGALNCVNLAAAKCIKCKGAEVEWAIDDCSHRSYCESCARLLEKKQSNCLVCGSPVTSVTRIFI